MRWRGILAALPRRVFPPRCVLCDEPCPDRDLCGGCRADLPVVGPACGACAAALPAPAALCGRCASHAPPMQLSLVPFRYEFPVDWLITRLKFHASLWHGPLLAELVADHALALLPADGVIVPVPLHRRRLAARGYNQALEIGRPLADMLGRDLDAGVLERQAPTREQSRLTARERRRNVAGAFRLRRAPGFAHAIVVDDVVTTGATVSEVARVLRRGGCERVTVLAVARAL